MGGPYQEDAYMSQSVRLPYYKLAPAAFQKMLELSAVLHESSLGRRLVDLIFLRVSQINGCAFCMDMHWRDLIAHGADARELNTLAGWRESPFFTEREQAALHWAELITRVPQTDASDEEYTRVRRHFSETEVAELGFTISTINAWNLLNVGFRNPVARTPAI